MSVNRLFAVLIAVVLVVLVAITAREAMATSLLVSQAHHIMPKGLETTLASPICMSNGQSISSVRSIYVKELNGWFPRTSKGYTGVDGGLIELLSGARTCTASEGH